MAEKKWSTGRSVSAAKGIPGTTTDCSGWAPSIPADQWSRGKSINAALQIPGTSTDCSGWDAALPVWVTVQVSPAAADDAPRVVELLSSLSPELGLRHDPARSAELGSGRRVVALAPTAVLPDLEARLYQLLPKVRQANSTLPIVNVGIEWDRPSAA